MHGHPSATSTRSECHLVLLLLLLLLLEVVVKTGYVVSALSPMVVVLRLGMDDVFGVIKR
jgi:hypothetical protein